jgi:hypothetical protein
VAERARGIRASEVEIPVILADFRAFFACSKFTLGIQMDPSLSNGAPIPHGPDTGSPKNQLLDGVEDAVAAAGAGSPLSWSFPDVIYSQERYAFGGRGYPQFTVEGGERKAAPLCHFQISRVV